jgi:hypothetical protein
MSERDKATAKYIESYNLHLEETRLGPDELKVLDTIIRIGETNTEKEKFAATEELLVSSSGQQIGSHTYPEIPRDVSPPTRIRLQKRLHMRRKRARERGEEASMELAPLPVGRRKKRSNLSVSQMDSTSVAENAEMESLDTPRKLLINVEAEVTPLTSIFLRRT